MTTKEEGVRINPILEKRACAISDDLGMVYGGWALYRLATTATEHDDVMGVLSPAMNAA